MEPTYLRFRWSLETSSFIKCMSVSICLEFCLITEFDVMKMIELLPLYIIGTWKIGWNKSLQIKLAQLISVAKVAKVLFSDSTLDLDTIDNF